MHNSLWDLQQVVLIATSVLAILNLFLPSLQNCSVGLRVGRVGQAGVTATEMGSVGGNLVLQLAKNYFLSKN